MRAALEQLSHFQKEALELSRVRADLDGEIVQLKKRHTAELRQHGLAKKESMIRQEELQKEIADLLPYKIEIAKVKAALAQRGMKINDL